MRKYRELPPEIEDYRDTRWCREGMRQIDTAFDAERFIEQVGFAACLTDCRRPGPSLYVAVCGRRDAVMPRNVQKDEEASHTWLLKDEIVRRGRVYYAKLARGKAMFLAPRMVPFFHAIWGLRRVEEPAGSVDRILEVGAGGHGRLANRPRGILPVLRLNGVVDVRGRELELRHLVGVDPDPHAVILPRGQTRIAHTRNAARFVQQIDGGVVA